MNECKNLLIMFDNFQHTKQELNQTHFLKFHFKLIHKLFFIDKNLSYLNIKKKTKQYFNLFQKYHINSKNDID